jgi:SAM-dependent methyltransferase
MAASFAEIVDLLCCPDDAESLRYAPGELLCRRCARRFSIHEENLLEILPRRPYELPGSVSPHYLKGYIEAFEQTYRDDETSVAWGAEETVPRTWALKRRRQVDFVRSFITEGSTPGESVLCDIAAGAGYYTLAYAPLFRLVLHCDLSVNNLNYAWRKASRQGIQNIFFLRVDYFALPFRRSLDRVLCLDTLIRGEAHDSALLAAIAGSLKPAGYAVVDFHNWWHNPLRRLGLLSENFHNNRSYRRQKAEDLLRHCGAEKFTYLPFIQEFDTGTLSGQFFARLLPATRLLYRFAPRIPKSLPGAMALAAGARQ